MRRTSPLKRTTMRQKRRRRQPVQIELKRAFRAAALAQRVCAVTGSNGAWDAHHVIEAQELRRRGGDDLWNTRNALRLARRVHERHTTATELVPLKALTDENLEFAVDLMGLSAYVYLTRHYAGRDERLELLIAELGAPDACG